MAEFWKSTPKYWCKHCNAFVKDTPFERRQHESTAKHQNNLKRSLRHIQNDHERAERDKQKAKAEVERLNRLPGTSASDATGHALPARSPHTSHKDKTGPRTADDQRRQWQQLADMGIQVPEHARANLAVVGAWRTNSQQILADPTEDSLSVGVRKRKLHDDDDDDDDEEEKEDMSKSSVKVKSKIWGKSIKTLPQSDDDQGHLDHLLSTSISLKNEQSSSGTLLSKREPTDTVNATSLNDSPGAEIPITSLQAMSDHQNSSPREGANPVLRRFPGTTVNLVKGDAVDEDHQSSFPTDTTPVSSPVPVFKKRKSKANSSNS